jgi:CBS domain-containing protein
MKFVVHTVKPHDSVAHARALLEEHRINQLPVLFDNHLVGIVTDRDLRDADGCERRPGRRWQSHDARGDARPDSSRDRDDG